MLDRLRGGAHVLEQLREGEHMLDQLLMLSIQFGTHRTVKDLN